MGIKATISKVFLLILGTVLIGTVGFKLTGGAEWSLVDSLYMAIITLSTVGFTEVHGLNTAGRVWAIIVISLGIGIVAYAITQITQYLLNFDRFRRRKMDSKIERLKNHFIVCGYGRMGEAICQQLEMEKLPFVIVEKDAIKIAQIKESGYWVVEGDATSDETLVRARIEKAKGLVVVLSSDSDNLFVTMSARTMNPDVFITSRYSVLQTGSKLKRAGADKIVNPYVAGAHKMAELLITPAVEDAVEITTPKYSYDLMIEEIRLEAIERYDGVKIRDSNLREDYNLLIAGIIKSNGDLVFNPNPGLTLQRDQTIMLIGQREDLKRFKGSFE